MDREQFLAENPLQVHAIVQADNRIVLKDIQELYSRHVDCVYIDPPYNNGERYNYYIDNASHSEWIERMRVTLELLKNLL